jgi:transcriptional regulator with XRE-family HTH domain
MSSMDQQPPPGRPRQLSELLNPKRIVAARKEAGLTQKELAKRLGIKPQSMSQLEDGTSKRTRYLSKLAEVLKRAETYFIEVDAPEEDKSQEPPIPQKYANYKGIVAAGFWQEETSGPPKPDRLLSIPAKRVAFSVFGESGHYVICQDLSGQPSPALRDSDIVVIERKHGGLTERSLKRVRGTEPNQELWPENDHRSNAKPLPLQSQESDITTQVVGLVIGYFRFA